MMRVALLLALIVPTLASSFTYPHRIVWRGTITTNGATGTLVARTHLRTDSRDSDPHYAGRFRCRGAGCPMRHGHIDFIPFTFPFPYGTTIYEIFFGARKPMNLYCVYSNDSPPPAYAIDGNYTCWTVVPPEPPPGRIVATGTMMLVPSRSPQP